MALCTVMAVVIAGFLGYHLYLASRNLTTNETFKWASVKASFRHVKEQADRLNEVSGESESSCPVM